MAAKILVRSPFNPQTLNSVEYIYGFETLKRIRISGVQNRREISRDSCCSMFDRRFPFKGNRDEPVDRLGYHITG